MFLEKGDALFEEEHIHFLEIEVWSDYAWSVVSGVGMLWQWATIHNMRGRDWNAITMDKRIEPIGRWTADGSEKMLESAMDWAVRN